MAAPRKTTPAPEPVGPATDQPFEFLYVDVAGKDATLTVPSLAVAEGNPNSLALAEARENNDQLLVTLLVVRAKTTPEQFAVLKTLPEDELTRFAQEWAAHSGVTPGK